MGYKVNAVAPATHLTSIVKEFFTIDYAEDITHTDYLLPNGLPSFFYIHAPSPVDTFFEEKKISLETGFYIGYTSVTVELTHKRMRVAGASVFPAYFKAVFGISPLDTIDRFTRLEDIDALREVSSLLARPDLDMPFGLFEKYITGQLNKHQLNSDFLQIYERLISPGGSRLTVEELAAQLGYSTRNLHARFTQYFGMSPKRFIRLVRFSRALQYMYDNTGDKNFSSIAHEAGYHDQSHLIRDFKAICGKTPKEISGNPTALAGKFRLF